MLILSRKPGDAVLIDGGIRIVVLSADGGGVRLGIEAPSSVGIVREEIARDIAEENVRAGATPQARAWLEALGSSSAAAEGTEGRAVDPADDTKGASVAGKPKEDAGK